MSAPESTAKIRAAEADRKPLMTTNQILLMNFGFFGIQYSFGMQQTAINPIFSTLGADGHSLPLLNLAGPITGLLIQPLIGALSDRTWSDRWGRRRPYFLIGAIGCSICLFLFPFASALWMAVLLLWLLDASNNTAMEPYRALLADKLPHSQLAKGFLMQSFFTGFGITLANFSLIIFKGIIEGTSDAGIPYWVYASFFLGAVCSIGSILVSVLSTKENPPTPEELAALRAKKGGLGAAVVEITHAVRDMPLGLHKLGLVYLFQWYAMVIYWQFVALTIGQNVFGGEPGEPVPPDAISWAGVMNGTYNIVTFLSAFFLVIWAKKVGAKRVHAICLLGASIALFGVSQITSQYLLLLPMLLLGVAWASMMGVPYILAVSMVPKERYGVYMGILNMMIVVPMIIQSLTFGWILQNWLGDDPANAMVLASVLMVCAAFAMLWIHAPAASEESEDMPLVPHGGGH